MSDYSDRYTDKKISEVDRALKKTYRTAQTELKKKLADFNKRFNEKSRKKKQQIKDGEITEQEYKDWLTGQVFIRNQWQSQINAVNSVLLDHNKQAIKIINNGTLDVFAESYNFNAFRAESEIVASFTLYNAESVARLILGDPQLLPEWKINEKKDYTWNYEKVNNIVRQAIIQGKNIEEITGELCSRLSTTNENKMRMFARTALGSAQNAGRQKQMEDAAEMGIEVNKQWIAAHDDRTRDSHRALDGEEVPFDKPFSNGLMFPKDPTGAPEEVYNCRCTMKTVYPKYEDRTKPDWRENEVINGKSYREWKKFDNYAEWKKWKEETKQVHHAFDRTVYIKDITDLLQKNAFNGNISDEYRKAIIESIGKADDRMLQIVKKTMGNVHVDFMEENPAHNVSHYSEGTGSITIITKDACGEPRTPEDILRTFWHEYGHFVDDAAVSGSGYGYKSEHGDYFFHSIQSEIMKDDKWMYAAAEDANRLLKFAGLDDRYECRFENGMYGASLFRKDGSYIDSRNPDFAVMNELEDGLTKWVNDFTKYISLDDYRKQFGYPERPEKKDFIESYFTPKRNLYRERELFKGASEAYNNAIREYYEKVDTFEKTHDMKKIYDAWSELSKETEKRKEAVAPATDTFDGGVCGAFSAFILYGGHEPRYYAVNRLGAKEGIANVFSSLMTKDSNELDAMNGLCPSLFNLIKGVILK